MMIGLGRCVPLAHLQPSNPRKGFHPGPVGYSMKPPAAVKVLQRATMRANSRRSTTHQDHGRSKFLEVYDTLKSELLHDPAFEFTSESRRWVHNAKAKQVEETNDFAPERELRYNDVLVKFLRPYAMIGIFMLCMGYMGRTCMESPELLMWSLLPKAVATFVAVLSTVAYNNGLNQLCDIEIDRINKPDLVLASGDMPLGLARSLVTSYFFIGILTSAFVQSKVLMACICIKFFFVYMYNAPPIRLKRTSSGAIFCGLVWGLMNSFSAYGAARHIIGLPFQLSLPVIFITTFTTVFHAMICILKDLSDVEGDRKFGVNTFAVMFGKRAIALMGSGILMLNYVFAIIMAIKNPQVFRQAVMIPAHIAMACILPYQVWKLEKAKYNKEDSQVFYKFIWKLVDAEWAIFPFI